MTETTTAAMAPALRQNMMDCMEAHVSCVELEERARKMDDLRVDGALLRVIRQCADMCRLTAEAAMHDCESRSALAKACVEVSRRCAEDCARFQGNVEMQRCADVCARAVLACQKLARG
jgi:hypothetical protein